MLRITNPYLRSSTSTWFAKIDGKAVQLGKKGCTEEDARKEWDMLRIKVSAENGQLAKNEKAQQLGTLLDYYLQNIRTEIKPQTYDDKAYWLTLWRQQFGEQPASDLKPLTLSTWVSQHDTWGQTTRLIALRQLSSAMAWLLRHDLISQNPVAKIRKPERVSRGEEVAIRPDDYQTLHNAASPHYRRLIDMLWETGSRPSEVLNLKAEEIDMEHREIVKADHKTAYKGKKRIILLTTKAAEIVREQLEKHPTGLLFPRPSGRATTASYFSQALLNLRAQLKIVRPCIPYGFRHGFAVRHLSRGTPIQVVAGWMGNTVGILERHYAHTLERVRDTRRWLEEEPAAV